MRRCSASPSTCSRSAPTSRSRDRATAVAVGAGAVALAALAALLLGRVADRTAPRVGALLTGLALAAALLGATDDWARGTACPAAPCTRYLATTPKDAMIAGDPMDLKCLPGTARRPVVISTQLAPSYEVDYFLAARERMFATLRAYYGSSPAAIAELGDRYGATHLWVRRDAVRYAMTHDGGRWARGDEPYGTFIRTLLRSGEPAVLHLPAACRSWRNGPSEVYDIGCIADAIRR